MVTTTTVEGGYGGSLLDTHGVFVHRPVAESEIWKRFHVV